MDKYLADGVCQAIATLKPDYFSLENVAGYMNFLSLRRITSCLLTNGYVYDIDLFDCAQYGVPQSRKRLFLVASKKSLVRLERVPLAPVVSWKEAIADLIPTLKPTTLTGWQIDRLIPWFEFDELKISDCVIQRSGARKKDGVPNNIIRFFHQPMFTVKAMSGTQRPSVKQATVVISNRPYEADTRCLARWQTIPDSYQFSGNLVLDTMAIGNAVPPLMFQKIITSTPS